MTGFAECFIAQGMEKGLEKGLENLEKGVERGIRQGEARMLLRQLSLRFGNLPDSVQARVESADADLLMRWSERILTASTLDEVFG
jgi:tartrate dehydratase alpha subunit/fumarate hydratase class I-like protein